MRRFRRYDGPPIRRLAVPGRQSRRAAKTSPCATGLSARGAVMDFSSQREWINALWILFGVYWLVSAFKRKKTKQPENWGQRLRYVLPLVVASYLLDRPAAHYGWLGARFVPASDA